MNADEIIRVQNQQLFFCIIIWFIIIITWFMFLDILFGCLSPSDF